MKAFAAASAHHQPEKRGRLRQREASTSRNSADDANTRFATMVLPHLDDAYTFAAWLAGNLVDAEHVVEDACLHAFHATNSFAGGNARVWILAIVRRRAHLWLRKDHPTVNAVVGSTNSMGPAPSAAHMRIEIRESPLAAETDFPRLQAALARLSVPLLETVVLRDIHGLNYREIAEVTEVPIGTVMSRLAQGRCHLIAAIDEQAREATDCSVA